MSLHLIKSSKDTISSNCKEVYSMFTYKLSLKIGSEGPSVKLNHTTTSAGILQTLHHHPQVINMLYFRKTMKRQFGPISKKTTTPPKTYTTRYQVVVQKSPFISPQKHRPSKIRSNSAVDTQEAPATLTLISRHGEIYRLVHFGQV